jgi:hypothetical protein
VKRAAVVAALVVGAAPAFADDACDESAADPVPVPVRAGGFDATRSACLRSDLDVRVGGHALIDAPAFYGTLGGDLQLGIRFVEAIGPGFEWGVAARVVDLTFAQTAVVTATGAAYGPLSVHGAISGSLPAGMVATGLVRFEVPFTRSVLDTSAAGSQLAGLIVIPAVDRVHLHGRAGLLGWYAASAGGTTTRGAAVVSMDASVRTVPWLYAVVGGEVQAGWYGGFDHAAARIGAHWRVRGPWRVDLGALAPVAGDERLDLAVTLGVRRDR